MKSTILFKTFCEIQYSNSLLFNDFNVLNDIKEDVNKDFGLNSYDQQNKVLILQNNDLVSMNIQENRIIINSDSTDGGVPLKDFIANNASVALKKLGVKKTNRLGLVQFFGIEVDNIRDAENKIISVFLNPSLKIHELGKSIVPSLNIRFSVNNFGNNKSLNNTYSTNILVSSATLQTIQANMGVQLSTITSSKNVISIQMDTYIMGMEVKNTKLILDDIYTLQDTLRKKVVEIVQG